MSNDEQQQEVQGNKRYKGMKNGTNFKTNGDRKTFQAPSTLPCDGNGRPYHKGARKLARRLKQYEKDSASWKGIPPTKPGSMQTH